MKFRIMGRKGDGEYNYDTIEMQKVKFDELLSHNMLPMEVTDGGNRMLKEFDPDVDEVVWIPKIIGG